jgi:Plasma-membrane choline transporter
MSNVPIVQGIAIDDHKYQAPYDYGAPQGDVQSQHNFSPTTHNEELRNAPVKQFQDVIWAVLFVAHLIVVGALIVMGLSSSSGAAFSQSSSYGGVIFVTCVTGLTGVGLSAAALSFMMQHAEPLVRMALIFSVATSLAIGIVGFMVGNMWMGGLGLLSFAIGCCYAKIVWPRIPFAATNLNTALTAVRANMGLTVASFGFTALAFAWTLLWFLGLGSSLSSSNGIFIFLLFLSYYWTHQVLKNTIHCATAGVVGTWWWVPAEANSFWSPALSDSLCRATTYSFGSVCLGSLLVAIVQALRALEYHSRGNDDLQFLSCIIQCILACIEGIIEELNKYVRMRPLLSC